MRFNKVEASTLQQQQIESDHSKVLDHIIVDQKNMPIWELVRFGNQGGVINFNDRIGIICLKDDQKWCTMKVVMYGKYATKLHAGFTPVKKVQDKSLVEKLKNDSKALMEIIKKLEKDKRKLSDELARYRTDGGKASVDEEVVL